MSKFQKGTKRPAKAGRRAGTPNKLTQSVKEAFEAAFNDLQSDEANSLLQWAKQNPTDFYKLAAKLIPLQLTGKDGERLFPEWLTSKVAGDK